MIMPIDPSNGYLTLHCAKFKIVSIVSAMILKVSTGSLVTFLYPKSI